ncbi:MAG: hypothetical protein A2Y82_01200 [Candidatus Buchananbacteria bacterium RBG_13_36_9]|uniref:N-acetyltransferase domain-containing protein n=1 Tax=Candidatus Buchananbacteria bacterium RBG_13_36_9 TaxID=1797530 RepID=A0A1G1XPS6_9BACT|nr:MAG: hypothetical protein A2Y82_01200 [Candidatus Buchananbacteria bacterium RBG_13_36_9]
MIECTVLTCISDIELQNEIWTEYKNAFAPLRHVTGQDQECFQKDQFFSMLTDEDYIKFVLFDESKFIGFGTLSSNLEKAARQSYANPIAITEKLVIQYSENNIFYFPAIFLISEHRNRKEIWLSLIGPMVKHVDTYHGAAAFDFSMNANPNLAENILFVVNLLQKSHQTNTKSAEFQKLDMQVYGVIKLS